MTTAVVGATGATVASADGALQVVIPAGALAGNVTVTIAPIAAPGTGAIGPAYEIGPTGTTFATPVTLTFDYGAANLAGTDPALLRVATYAPGGWQILSGVSVDTQEQTVSGTTMHLSPYGLVPAANGAMCATVSGGVMCSSSGTTMGGSGTAGVEGTSTDSGGSTGSGTGSGGSTGSGIGLSATTGAGATAGGYPTCVPSTCAAVTDACAAYPGATMTNCTDGPDGYQATCCFPSGASICLAAGGGGGACTEDCSVGGSCTTTCSPASTCSTATSACSSLPGSTLQSCVDGTEGYSAACCYPPGAPVCTTVAAGGGCASGTSGAGGTIDCPSVPQCANGDPCAGIAGTTMQSCTDSANGYTAVCCLPVGELPSADGGGQVSSSGGVGGASGGGANTSSGGGASTSAGGGASTGTGGGASTSAGGGASTGTGGGTTGAGGSG